MREWCGCGAAIRASKRDVMKWRSNHRHDGPEDPEPERQGSFSDHQIGPTYHVSADGARYIPPIEARRIGFVPND